MESLNIIISKLKWGRTNGPIYRTENNLHKQYSRMTFYRVLMTGLQRSSVSSFIFIFLKSILLMTLFSCSELRPSKTLPKDPLPKSLRLWLVTEFSGKFKIVNSKVNWRNETAIYWICKHLVWCNTVTLNFCWLAF